MLPLVQHPLEGVDESLLHFQDRGQDLLAGVNTLPPVLLSEPLPDTLLLFLFRSENLGPIEGLKSFYLPVSQRESLEPLSPGEGSWTVDNFPKDML